ncbi:MAG: type 3 dihydrofolate reductase [Leucothrix sp.]
MIISMISAMAQNRVIGLDGKMPWHLPADLAHFKRSTMGCPVIMGRKTFDSIGRPLPGRMNIVLSRSAGLSLSGCEVVATLDNAFELVKGEEEVFIIGGQQLYQQALPLAQRLYLTHIDAQFEGDTYFPDYTQICWSQSLIKAHLADEKNAWPYQFEILERVSTPSE